MYVNEIKLIQDLIKDIDKLSSNHLEMIEPIRNRAGVIIKNVFGDSCNYYENFNEIIFPEYLKHEKYTLFNSGNTILNIFFSNQLEKAKNELLYLLNTMIKDLELKDRFYLPYIIEEKWLPEDILLKGKEMSRHYIHVYFIENSLRIFIAKICTDESGDDFMKKISLSTDLSQKIGNRKSDEKKHKWLSVRGESDLFYLDLEDLGKIIQNNWGVFSNHFPNQKWIIAKIEEISKIRNLIAHNNYVEKNDCDLLEHYYIQILKQIRT